MIWFKLNIINDFDLNVNVFIDLGSAYGTAKSGVGIQSMGIMHPQLVMRNMIPIIMSGVLPIYGLIIAIILSGSS